nr:hypothetical protein CFP56_38073 [Quercus suber]
MQTLSPSGLTITPPQRNGLSNGNSTLTLMKRAWLDENAFKSTSNTSPKPLPISLPTSSNNRSKGQRTETSDQQRIQPNIDEQGDLVVVQEVQTEVAMEPGNGSETTLTECTSSQSFQAKFDEIDGELSRFDRVEDGSDSL